MAWKVLVALEASAAEPSAAEALVVAMGVGAARALAVAAQRWAPPVARPVKEPSVAAPRAVLVGVVAAKAVEAAGAAVAVAAVLGDPQSEQLEASWALAAWEVVARAAAARARVAAARARGVAMRAVAKEVGVTVAGAEAVATGRVIRQREEAEATGRGSMVAGATAVQQGSRGHRCSS